MAPGHGSRLRVRMYKQGLGDCFLLTFEEKAHLLLDCGTIGATEGKTFGMDRIVEDIVKTVGTGPLVAVVATHEHTDHVSGFETHIEQLRELGAVESWQAWTEDPSDDDARDLEKYKEDLVKATALAAGKLNDVAPQDASLGAMGTATLKVLEFNAAGLKEHPNTAMTNALRLGKNPVFLKPGMMFERDWAPGVHFFVLGPPRDPKALHDMGRPGSPELYDFSAAVEPDSPGANSRMPFEEMLRREEYDPETRERCAASYDDPAQAWRRIDHDWLGVASDFALQLDSYTNNTSLVLALELDGKVLLFPGDAQLGSWRSWQKLSWKVKDSTVTAADLFKRTVFYKVGHHSSHNATATTLGLELMESEDLVAFIPLDGEVARNKQWQMPAKHLYQRLLEKTQGRVLRSDLGWPEDGDRPDSVSDWAWRRARSSPRVVKGELYIDYLF